MTEPWADCLDTADPAYDKRDDCPDCEDGEILVQGYSISPFSGVPVPDPQAERTERCPTCSGTGRAPL